MRYVVDAPHFLSQLAKLDPAGGLGDGLGDFFNAVVAQTTLQSSEQAVLECIECSTPGKIESHYSEADSVQWSCGHCGSSGEIRNWRHTPWDKTAPYHRPR